MQGVQVGSFQEGLVIDEETETTEKMLRKITKAKREKEQLREKLEKTRRKYEKKKKENRKNKKEIKELKEHIANLTEFYGRIHFGLQKNDGLSGKGSEKRANEREAFQKEWQGSQNEGKRKREAPELQEGLKQGSEKEKKAKETRRTSKIISVSKGIEKEAGSSQNGQPLEKDCKEKYRNFQSGASTEESRKKNESELDSEPSRTKLDLMGCGGSFRSNQKDPRGYLSKGSSYINRLLSSDPQKEGNFLVQVKGRTPKGAGSEEPKRQNPKEKEIFTKPFNAEDSNSSCLCQNVSLNETGGINEVKEHLEFIQNQKEKLSEVATHQNESNELLLSLSGCFYELFLLYSKTLEANKEADQVIKGLRTQLCESRRQYRTTLSLLEEFKGSFFKIALESKETIQRLQWTHQIGYLSDSGHLENSEELLKEAQEESLDLKLLIFQVYQKFWKLLLPLSTIPRNSKRNSAIPNEVFGLMNETGPMEHLHQVSMTGFLKKYECFCQNFQVIDGFLEDQILKLNNKF